MALNLVAVAVSWQRGLLHCSVPLLAAVSCGLFLLHTTTWGANHKRWLKVATIVGVACGAAVVAIVVTSHW
ncbi:MAG TPA: hypothetical protein VFY93_18530 [Planctomycetota bacterium]|nr:hypothetical protein [Planctomycetota bacterium]